MTLLLDEHGRNLVSAIEKLTSDRRLSVSVLALLDRSLQVWRNPSYLVLDPSAGTGSTCVATAGLDRRFLGVELCQGTAEKARETIDAVPVET